MMAGETGNPGLTILAEAVASPVRHPCDLPGVSEEKEDV